MPIRKRKVAVFVDWENIRKGVFDVAYKNHGKKVSYNDVANVLKFFTAFVDGSEDIYRIFVYLCEPYSGIINSVDYKKTQVFATGMRFIDKLKIQDNIAVRKGKLAYKGLDKNGNPIFGQKQVDMLLGLDIAHVAYKRLADKALILSADTDMVPAMKTARINGLQVIWGYCPDIQTDPSTDLRTHSDLIRTINFNDIFS